MPHSDETQQNTIEHIRPRVIAGKNGGRLTPFDSERGRAAVRIREEKRMRLYNEGAQLAVARGDLIEMYGADAHLVERAITLQQIATTKAAIRLG